MTISQETLSTPIFVTDNATLNALCRSWKNVAALALDTEFIRIDTFFPKLGLLQICDGEASYLLDPLILTDWDAFKEVLADQAITKVLHSCSEDLVVLDTHFEQLPSPLFDTQKAAAFLGLGYSISYQNLVKQLLNIDISKGETRSDWLRRPLSQEQLVYAALDVAYLPEIFRLLQTKLSETDRLAWLETECKTMLVQTLPEASEHEWENYYLNMGAAWRLDLTQLAVLQQLCLWREREARRRNKPRSWIAKDTDLMTLAESVPKDRNALLALSGISRPLLYQDAAVLLEVINQPSKELTLQPDSVEQPLTPEMRKLLKKCQEVVRNNAETLGIAPELLARKKQLIPVLDEFKRSGTFTWPEELNGWRQSILEDELREIIG